MFSTINEEINHAEYIYNFFLSNLFKNKVTNANAPIVKNTKLTPPQVNPISAVDIPASNAVIKDFFRFLCFHA